MSPYMKAYDAGVKLAKYEWRSKIADKQRAYSDPDDGGDMSVPEAMPEESEVASEGLAGAPSYARGNTYSDMLRNLDTEYLGGMGSRAYDSISDYFSGGSAPAAAPQPEFQLDQQFRSQGEDQFPGMAAEQGRSPLMGVASAPPQQGFVPDQQFRSQGEDQFPGMAEAGRGNVPRFDYRAVGQDGMASEDARFNVQAGNYRKQFNRFRDQFGGEGAGAFEGLNYRDFANALDNRGLRVGDSLDANQVMSRLQNIRQTRFNESQGFDNPAGPVANNTFDNPLQIQNRRGNVANRGSLSSMLSARQKQAPANVNPFGGLRGAGSQRQAPAPKPASTSTPKKPGMPKFVGPGNIDSIMGK